MSSIYNDPKPFPPGGDNPVFAEPYMPPGAPASPPPKSKTGWGCLGCALGCLGFVVVLLIIAAAGAWYAYTKLPDMARGLVAKGVEESELDPEDKQKVMQQVDRLVEGYKQKKVDLQQLAKFGEDFMKSPLMDIFIAFAARKQYIEKSGLSAEEKMEAERTLQRVARGVIEEKITQEELQKALDYISEARPNGAREFKQTVTDAELREFLSECKKLADEEMIPDQESNVDVGAELKKLVDKTLGEAPPAADPGAPRTSPEPPPHSTPETPPSAETPSKETPPAPATDPPPAADSAAKEPAKGT